MSRKKIARQTRAQYVALSDAALIILYRLGDAMALTVLIERHTRQLVRYAYRIIHDYKLAEDVVQEAWTDAWQAIKKGRYKEDDLFTRWMTRNVHNRALKMIELLDPQTPKEAPEQADDALNAEEQIMKEQRRSGLSHALDEALKHLPPMEEQIIRRHEYNHESYDDIALDLNMKAKSVKEMCSRGRHRLRQWLGPLEGIL